MFAKSGVTVPGVPGDESMTASVHLYPAQHNLVFCEEHFEKALYVHLTYKNVDRFWNGSVHE